MSLLNSLRYCRVLLGEEILALIKNLKYGDAYRILYPLVGTVALPTDPEVVVKVLRECAVDYRFLVLTCPGMVSGDCALSYACRRGSVLMSRYILRRGGVALVSKDSYKPTFLHLAAGRGHLPLSSLLVKAGAYPRATCTQGLTPLHCASAGGHLSTMTFLMDLDPELVNIYDDIGRSPLYCAVARNQVVRKPSEHLFTPFFPQGRGGEATFDPFPETKPTSTTPGPVCPARLWCGGG